MTITYVLKIAVPADQSIQQYREMLEKRLATLKPRKLSKFQVQTIAFQSQTTQSMIHQFLHSDYPATCFSLIESAANDIKVLTGDIGLAGIQRKISELNILAERKQLQIECQGSVFKLGDFQFKLGAVTHASSNRGLLAEVTYSSANTNHDAYGVICEFVLSTFGWSNLNEMVSNFVRRKQPNANYGPEDTIVQYFEHFTFYRNAAVANR
jgi:hypothetical protein